MGGNRVVPGLTSAEFGKSPVAGRVQPVKRLILPLTAESVLLCSVLLPTLPIPLM